MLDIITFLKILLQLAPEAAEKVRSAVVQWGNVYKVPTDRIIRSIEPGKFDEVDRRIDRTIDALDIPDGEPTDPGDIYPEE